jgi:DNA-binding MarR family transcriptional regulator
MTIAVDQTHSEQIADQILVSLRRIIRATDLHSRCLLRDFGLTGPQLVVLRQLAGGQVRSGSEIARAVSLSLATTVGILSRLEARGLVRRERSTADRRQKLVTATQAGVRLLEAAPPPLQVTFTRELAALEEWEQTQVLAVLQRVVSMMEAEELDASPILTTGRMAEPGAMPGPDDGGGRQRGKSARAAAAEPEEVPECAES